MTIAAFVIVAFSFLPAQAASITLAWNPDPSPDLVGYRLHCGTDSRSYTTHKFVGASATSATIANLEEGKTYYFAATTTNRSRMESAYSAEISYTVPSTAPTPPAALPLVSVVAGNDASEPKQLGSFHFTRTGDATRTLTVFFTLDGDAQAGVDYRKTANRIIFRPGQTNATLWIRPVADRIFEGAKTLEITLVSSNNVDLGDLDSAAILIGDDDRPRINISASKNSATGKLQTTVHAAAYSGFNVLLQRSTDLTNWSVVTAPLLEQPVDYLDSNPTDTPTRFYRAIYVRGTVTENSVAEALYCQLYSANIVGVVNVQLQPGWNLAANPLNGTATNGPLGDLPAGTRFVPFNSTKLNTYIDHRWSRGVPLTRSTMGGGLYNPSNAPVTISYVGEVPVPASKPTIPAGWSVRSSVVSETVSDDLLLGYPLHAGDALYEFNQLGTGPDIWVTHLRGSTGWDIPPLLSAGQGVMIYKTKSTRASVVTTPKPPTLNLHRFTPVAAN